MRERTPVGSRKWKEITDFDLKVLSTVIIVLSLITISLFLYAFYLKMQKSQVDVVIREVNPNTQPPVETTINTATQTLVIVESATEVATDITEPTITVSTDVSSMTNITGQASTVQLGQPIVVVTPEPTESAASANEATQSTQVDENKYLKDLTKFDYDLLVSRMAENLPEGTFYLYTVDGETALKIAKKTQNYVIDRGSGGKYYVVTTKNVMPDLKSSNAFYTIKTNVITDSKEAFKSVVNLRTVGISAFSVTTKGGYSICMGIFTSENEARDFYYGQDWTELSKYATVKGAAVSRVGG
ncbi:MAG TPA: hypothetical protein DHW87_04830 [Fervidobacterium sp.]|nr:hypothetical protein [Fervidobacterium sp.]HUM75360.1 hypothetical protein [Fervidobacterium sp.]